MGSRKEEERNEKIIRGLMKLPPNRKCINCNSLGPQYICTNFWTFICMTCSGIHREFTHRVKSVSMAKFTSQEVEALQNGGNQRARDVYLRDWDFQMQRLPDSSNVNKIREFIRNVYVDRRYTGSKSSGKPPRDNQSPTLHDDETRRASSYHSYSQSPPYDYQYEDRRYGKQAAALTRKPGSDKGRSEGKISSFIYSPGRFSDHAYHDKFSNGGSVPRISDYTVSSGGEQFKSDVQSTEFHKDIGFSNSSGSCEDIWSQARNTSLEIKAKRDADEIHHPKRTTSLGSTDGNLSSFRSLSSGGLVDFFPEPVQTSGSLLDKVSAVQPTSGPAISVDLDLSKEPEPFSSSASSIDLFQLSASSQPPSVDLFQSSASSAPFFNENQPTFQPSSIDLFAPFSHQQSAATSEGKPPELFEPFSSSSSSIDLFQLPASSQPPSVDLFQLSASSIPYFNKKQPTFQTSSIDLFAPFSHQQSASPSEEKSPELSVAKNEGWATFDMPQFTASATQVENPAGAPSTNKSVPENFDPFSNFNASIQWPSFEISSVQEPFSVALNPQNPQHDGAWNGEEQASITATISQPWNAFEDSGTELPVNALNQGLELHDLPSTSGQYLVRFRTPEGFDRGGMQGVAPVGGFKSFDDHNIPSNVASSQPDPQSLIPVMGEVQANKIKHKSTNPFDLPFDSDIEQNNMFLDMSSLQAALPDAQLPPTYPSSIAEPWLTQNSVNSYISCAGQGGLTYLAAQPPSSQLLNIQTEEPVAAFGGNSFA